MTRSSRIFFLILILLLLALGSIPSGLFVSRAAVSSGYKLINTEQFTAYGQFLVNESLIASSSTSQPLGSVTFGFPSNYTGNMYSISSGYYIGNTRYPSSISTSVSNNTLLVTLSLNPEVPAGNSANISLGFYVLNSYKPLTVTNYLVPMLFYPSVSVLLDNLTSKVQFPYQTTSPVSNPFGFKTFVGEIPLVEIWTYSSNNASAVQPRWAEVQLNSSEADTGYVDFQSIQRTVSVDATGSPVVTDVLTLKNLGLNTLTNMEFGFLTNSTTITIEPSNEPPLSNVETMTVSNGEIDLGGINRRVEPGAAVTVIMQYNLGTQYWNYSSGVYRLKIPNTGPVNALVDSFSLGYDVPSDYSIVSSPLSIHATYTVGFQGSSFFSYRRGLGSAFGFALPFAGLIFIGVFLGVLVTKPRARSEEGSEETVESMVKAFEEKVSGTNDILSELRGKGEGMSRNDLSSSRSRIEELRSKTLARFTSLRSQMGQTSVEVQSMLNLISSNDREFDRAVKDLLNNYDQFISKRMKADTLAKVQQNNGRRIQHLANSLLDALHDLKSEYEH